MSNADIRGRFIWHELLTTDTAGAAAFYAGTFLMPTMVRLREWYASPEYAEALKVRRTALERRLVFVEGVAP